MRYRLISDIAEITYEWAVTHGGYNPADFSSYDTNPADSLNGLQEFLQKLAWGGLENTTTFQMLYPDTTLAQQQI